MDHLQNQRMLDPQDPMPGFCLWTSTPPPTRSSQLCSMTSFSKEMCLTPCVGGLRASWQTDGSSWGLGSMTLTRSPLSPSSLFSLYTNSCTSAVCRQYHPPQPHLWWGRACKAVATVEDTEVMSSVLFLMVSLSSFLELTFFSTKQWKQSGLHYQLLLH